MNNWSGKSDEQKCRGGWKCSCLNMKGSDCTSSKDAFLSHSHSSLKHLTSFLGALYFCYFSESTSSVTITLQRFGLSYWSVLPLPGPHLSTPAWSTGAVARSPQEGHCACPSASAVHLLLRLFNYRLLSLYGLNLLQTKMINCTFDYSFVVLNILLMH